MIVGTLLVAVAGLPLLMYLQFDFNPTNLRSPKVEVDRDLSRPAARSRRERATAQVLVANADAAHAVAEKLAALPEVARVRTIDSLVPTDQAPKLARIRAAATALHKALYPAAPSRRRPTARSSPPCATAPRRCASQPRARPARAPRRRCGSPTI